MLRPFASALGANRNVFPGPRIMVTAISTRGRAVVEGNAVIDVTAVITDATFAFHLEVDHDPPSSTMRSASKMIEECFGDGSAVDRERLGAWLRRHFPRMMRSIPTRRFEAFLDGVTDSFLSGAMVEDLPLDSEPVEVDLDDPCGGDRRIVQLFRCPQPRRVVYECWAPGCRTASRLTVERLASKHGVPVHRVGDVIAVELPVGASLTID